MQVKVTEIWPESSRAGDIEKELNELKATRIVSVEPYGDYQYRVIYEVE